MSLGLKYKNNVAIFVERQRGGVPYLSYPLLENTGIVNHGFSTRLGGVSTGCFSSMNISLTRGDDPEAVEEKNAKPIAGNRRRSGRFYLYAADTYDECKARVRQGEGTVLS